MDEALHAAGLRVVAAPRLSSVQVLPHDGADDGASDAGRGALPWLVGVAGVTTGALVALGGAALHPGVFLA